MSFVSPLLQNSTILASMNEPSSPLYFRHLSLYKVAHGPSQLSISPFSKNYITLPTAKGTQILAAATMRRASIFLMVLIIVSASAPALASPAMRRSRFLAGLGPKDKQCSIDPSVCAVGQTCCGDQCVDTSTDALNCGKCAKICKFTDSCCSGKCVDISFDKRNCGSCGNRCNPGVLCYYGMCNYA